MIEKEKTEIKTSDTGAIEDILAQKELMKIYDRGSKDRYLFKKTIIPNDAQKRYFLLKELISDLKDLLFKDIDPKDKKEKTRINELYEEINTALQIKIDNRKEEAFYKEIGNDKIPIIKIKSDDAGIVECFREDIEKTREYFIKQQYNSHLPNLELVLSKIEKELIDRKIIPIEKPKIKDILDLRIQDVYKKTKEKIK